MKEIKKPLISLILCSRNDSYMGNSRWRLETSINLTILHAKEAHVLNHLEIIISDWGSEIPLSEVLSLIPEAETIVKFIHVSPGIAQKEQKDSKFPEVIALNTAVRKASGEYIGRIDNDTVIGTDFFRKFHNLHRLNPTDELDLRDSFLFVERKSVPYRISSLSLSLNIIKGFIKFCNKFLKIESATEWGRDFWWSPVGIMMFHRDIWEACRGYDESLIYWGWMEGDLALRLGQKHKIVEFSKYVGHDFYHLEHYSNLTEYKDRNGVATPRKKNEPRFEGLKYCENEDSWGLEKFNLSLKVHNIDKTGIHKSQSPFGLMKLALGVFFLVQDKVIEFSCRFFSRFRISFGKLKIFRCFFPK
jgi:hypothetical protein